MTHRTACMHQLYSPSPSLIPHASLIPSVPTSQILRREPKPRAPRLITKHHKLRLQENIPKDRQPNTSITLQSPKAAPAPRRRRIIHIITRHNSLIIFDAESKVGEFSGARKDVAAISPAIGRARDLGIVVGDEVVWQEEEGSARVSDGGEAVADSGAGADRIAPRRESPKALRAVHRRVGDLARILARVDEAEVVATGCTLFQVCREERGVEAGLGVVEEGLCLVGLDGVDLAEGEAKKTIALVLSEFRADLLGQFDGLAVHLCTADVDDIGVDVAAGGAAISITDAPSLAVADLGGRGPGGVVDVVPILLVTGQLG